MKASVPSSFVKPGALALHHDLTECPPVATLKYREITIDVVIGTDCAWIVVRLPHDAGYALRAAPGFGAPLTIERSEVRSSGAFLRLSSSSGTFDIEVTLHEGASCVVEVKSWLTPCVDLCIPYWPRDLYILGPDNDPTRATGEVLAAQRGLNSGIVYLRLKAPDAGSLLYFQNFTELNQYFLATGTTPDSAVGGEWPELGYQPPTSLTRPLIARESYVVSNAFLAVNCEECSASSSSDCSLTFLELLANIYQHLDPPKTRYHGWPERAKATLKDLGKSDKLTTSAYGHLYVRPYVNAEYPDSMVQLSVLAPLRLYERWCKHAIPAAQELEHGLRRFYDKDKSTLRRYLPNVGSDKDADEIDSWYLYHPLSNLGRLACAGDESAKALFFESIDFGIDVAHHFKYWWPVLFKLSTLEVIKYRRKPTEPGQSDVGGIYAYVMMQAHELSGDARYLDEAIAALRRVENCHFELLYQSNLTSWGAAACAWVFEVTEDRRYLNQSTIFLANLFHNAAFWQSELGFAQHYPMFSGVSCLHDGPYMAIYECYETFMALSEYLARAFDELPPSVQLLVSEHIKYGPHRAWSFYPDTLPEKAVSDEVRNGEIDRTLSIPVEDLYVDGRQAGTVGQEVYGCGAAFVFTALNYYRLPGETLILYCEYPVTQMSEIGGSIRIRILGDPAKTCRARLMRMHGHLSPDEVRVPGSSLRATAEGHIEFRLRPGYVAIELRQAVESAHD